MALILPSLLVVADRDFAGSDEHWLELLAAIGTAAQGKSVAIQVRAKGVDPEQALDLARAARRAVPEGVPLILNGDPAIALAEGYDGVHWPEAAIPEGGPAVPDGLRWRFAAVHSAGAARRAVVTGADALVFAPVYAPGSKAGTGVGLPALQAVVTGCARPVFALGGITPERAAACIQAGAHGVAAISGVLAAPSPAVAVDAYLAAIGAGATTA